MNESLKNSDHWKLIMPLTKLRPTYTLTEDRLRELQAILPEAFADGQINWGTLREALDEKLGSM